MIILLGSTRPAKVDGAGAALTAIASVDARFGNPHIQTFDLAAVAPPMPMSEAAIVDGARRRARTLAQTPAFVAGDSFSVGLEGGLSPITIEEKVIWTLQTWAAVTNGSEWGYGAGGAITIPDAIARRVIAGEELGEVIDQLVGEPTRGTRGAWGVLTCDLSGRRDAFRLAVLAAFAPFYNAAAYTRR